MSVHLSESTVKRCANAFRVKVTETGDGEFLGSEEELIAYFGVSRPTFRQAAKILESENLLTIKRGVGGGYFARRPSIDMVAHITSVYLNSQNAKINHIYRVTWTLYIDTAREAAANKDVAVRQSLKDFYFEGRELEELCQSVERFIEIDERFSRQYSKLADNPIMELFLNIVYDYCSETTHLMYNNNTDRMTRWIKARNKLIECIVEGHQKNAVAAAKSCCNISKKWITEDLERVGDAQVDWKFS